MIRAILFDKDGTLIEFTETWGSALEIFIAEMRKSYSLTDAQIKRMESAVGYEDGHFIKESPMQYMSASQVVELLEASLDNTVPYEQIYNMLQESSLSDDLDINACRGVAKLLDYLKDKGYTLGVVTADEEESTYHSLEKTGLLKYFDALYYDDGIVESKPSPYYMNEFLKKTDLSANEVLVVGDSGVDMQFAENSGSDFIGIRTECNNYSEFKKRGYDVVDCIYDIISLRNL